jgi:alkylresorcinol/alkylpyrone synthase
VGLLGADDGSIVTSEPGILATARAPGGLAVPVRLAGFGSASPPHRAGPEELGALIARVWPDLTRHVRPLLDQSAAVGRSLARPPDQLDTPLPPAVQTSSYERLATALAAEAAEGALAHSGVAPREVGLLVVASCTGFVLPGVDVALCARLGLREDVARIPLTLFGCGGGAAGLAHAADWVRGHADQAALVVAVELPSLTFRPDDTSVDNLLSVLVFGDGAAAHVVAAGEEGFLVGRTRSVLVPASREVLGYRLAAGGFQVVLSRRLPELLATALPLRVAAFLGDVTAPELDAVAVHPGGPGILEAVERCLGLSRAQTAASWVTLGRTGNTSSAAVLSVLGELSASPPAPSGRGLAIGFGPGVSIELLELFWRC